MRPRRERSPVALARVAPGLPFYRSHTVHAYCVNTLLEEVFKRLNTSLRQVFKHSTLSTCFPTQSVCRCWSRALVG